ncbi:MAG: NUDIX hydrolase [Thermomicrobiales bacterium]
MRKDSANPPQTPKPLHSAQPSVELRVVPLTFAGGELHVLLWNEAGTCTLPLTTPEPSHTLDETAVELVRRSLGFSEQYLEQLYSLSDDTREHWSIIISYIALVRSSDQLVHPKQGSWQPLSRRPVLSPSDQRVVEYALFRLRAKLGYTTIAFHLMPELFTLSELQTVFETILDRTLDKRNFRRRMATLGILAGSRESRRDGSHRPAKLYRFLPDRDPTDYLTPPWASTQPEEQGVR